MYLMSKKVAESQPVLSRQAFREAQRVYERQGCFNK